MEIGIIIGLGIGILILIAFIIWQKSHGQINRETLEKSFQQTAQQSLGMMMQEVIKATREQLGAEKKDISESISKDLKTQTDSFKEVTESLKKEIDERQREIRKFEVERNEKYGQIAQALTDYKGLTEELRGSTEQLKRVLSSNQMRGSWGELQAEKILEAAGMIEGTHYAKQQPVAGNANLRPDFTLFLPNHMELYVDVKFPLQSLQLAMAATTKGEQEQHFKQFGNDLKARIAEAGKYVLGQASSVDYVILFVPSESVFEIINKNFASIVDASFSQQVILVSPHSFFAVVRTIQESYTHFYYEQNLRDIMGLLQKALKQFEMFKGEFVDVGKALESAQAKYLKIAENRTSQIDKITDKITTYQINDTSPVQKLPELPAASETNLPAE